MTPEIEMASKLMDEVILAMCSHMLGKELSKPPQKEYTSMAHTNPVEHASTATPCTTSHRTLNKKVSRWNVYYAS